LRNIYDKLLIQNYKLFNQLFKNTQRLVPTMENLKNLGSLLGGADGKGFSPEMF